jgi:hypothetical protein
MNLGYVDPPYEDFEWSSVIFPKSLFENEHRNSCYTNATTAEECCPMNEAGCSPFSNYIAGATVLHEFGHALGLLHEH